MKIVCETQTQVVEATQDIQVSFAASEAPTEEVVDLGDKTANEKAPSVTDLLDFNTRDGSMVQYF